MVEVNVAKLVLDKVSRRIKERISSLEGLLKPEFAKRGLGLEGWFKVEVVNALGDDVKAINNRGPDLEVSIEGRTMYIELKAHNLLHWAGIKDSIKKYKGKPNTYTLFLKRKNPDSDIKKAQEYQAILSEVNDNWIIGIAF